MWIQFGEKRFRNGWPFNGDVGHRAVARIRKKSGYTVRGEIF